MSNAHVLGLEGRDTKATLGEQAAEGGDEGALAGVEGCAEDCHEARYSGGSVQSLFAF
jgi:hypothetical protein